MTPGKHYFRSHPRLAFTVYVMATVALGYISNLLQQYWIRDSYLLLHIASWWMVTVLWVLYKSTMAEPLPQPERTLLEFDCHLRLHALLYGDSPPFHDAEAEEDEDDPTVAPLFRLICQSLQRWQLSSLTVSPDIGEQVACLSYSGDAQITLQFDNWGFA